MESFAADSQLAAQLPALAAELAEIVGADGVVARPSELAVYECDGWTIAKSAPDLLVLPRTTAHVSGVLAALERRGIAFVPRGAGTGLSGGCLPLNAPVMICTSRMNRIVACDLANRRVEVESGVVNLNVTNAVKAAGYFYAPDPSSQVACTIGGNIAENSGGPHTLKYGVTTNHVLGVELVLAGGEVVELGGPADERLGYDLLGAVVGAEGTAGIVTRATLRLLREPQAHRTMLGIFADVERATAAVSAIIAAGIVPGAIEMMDAAHHPRGRGGVQSRVSRRRRRRADRRDRRARGRAERARRAHRAYRHRGRRGRGETRARRGRARAAVEGRKRAFGAVGRLAPNYATQDGVVPRTRLPDILRVISMLSRHYKLAIGNVFHAGDGNIHPIVLYDERDPDQVRRAIEVGREILKACVEMGGSLTGEHGIGVEKQHEMPLLFAPEDLIVMSELRRVFDPNGHANPGKIIPQPGGCVEVAAPRRQAPL